MSKFIYQNLLILFLLCIHLITQAQEFPQQTTYQGIQVTCNVTHLDKTKSSGKFYEGDNVIVQFKVSDTISQEGLSGVYPAAWLGKKQAKEPASCQKKIESYLSGSILHQADLDLNVYYVLAMNEEPSITVVDPLFGYGGTKLLARIQLNSPGTDWTITEDQEHIFVSLPATKEVAVIQASNWKVAKNIAIPGVPVHTRIQEDGAWLWVTYTTKEKDAPAKTGVVVINTATFEIKKVIPTGSGWHELTLSDDSRYAYISNGLSGTVSVIDILSLEIIATIHTGENPTNLAWSKQAKTVLVGHKAAGKITVLDGYNHKILTTIQAEPGIEQIAIAPNGRLAFVVNSNEDFVHIIDLAVNQIVQTAEVEDQPDAVYFTDGLAYIRHRGSETILMIPLEAVGVPNTPVHVIDFPGGQNPAGRTNFPAIAPGIVQTPGESAVLVANPMDRMVYYYMEGMAAPMGNFSNYGREPRAVMVVDRSLQEVGQGVYETTVQLQKVGQYDLAFFMNAPRLSHCFSVNINIDKNALLERQIEQLGALEIEFLSTDKTLYKSQEKVLRFKVKNRRNKEIVADLTDLKVLQMKASGIEYKKRWANATETAGVYEVAIDNLSNGIYHFYVECPSQQFTMANQQAAIYEVID